MMLRQRVTHMWRTGQYIKPADSGFHPRQIYVPGVQGAVYRPRDLSTLFLDYPPTAPVTAMEQQVATMLDISGNGNHAFQTTSGKRAVVSRRVNIFTESEFRNGVTDAPTRSGLVTASTLPGYLGAIAFGHNGITDSYAYKSATPLIGFSAILSVVVQMTDGGVPVTTNTGAGADFMLVMNGNASYGASVVSLGGGFYRIISQPAVITASNTGVIKYKTNSSRTFKVTAYDLRLAIDAHLPYQRVNTATDYDDNAFKFPTYLRFDGAATVMQTNAIDFTGTDKMTVVAGVTKLSDAAAGVIAHMGLYDSQPGFTVVAPTGAIANVGFRARRSTLGPLVVLSGLSAPINIMTTGSYDAVQTALRANGLQTNNATSAGAGNFANKQLFIGAQDGVGSFFNGRLYPLIVAGAQMTPEQLAASEAWMAAEMMLPA